MTECPLGPGTCPVLPPPFILKVSKENGSTFTVTPDVVSDLLKTPFSRCPFGDLKNKQTTKYKINTQTRLTNASKGFMHFKDCNCVFYEWIIANAKHQKLFFCLCLLFNTNNRTGLWLCA